MSFRPMLLSTTLAALLWACGAADSQQAEPAADHGAGEVVRVHATLDEVVPEDYQIEDLAGGLIFTEGPLWVTGWEENPFLLFSDVPGNAIYRWNPAGNVTEFKKPVFSGDYEEGRFIGSNGLTLDKEGVLYVCEHGNRRISRVTRTGEWTPFVERYQNKRFNSPNDAVFKSDGWLYFTDPPYGLMGQDEDPAKELAFNGVFRVSPDGRQVEKLAEQSRPNGLAFSPDEKTLYVANSDPERKVWMAYPVADDGTLGSGRVFYDVTSESAEGLPDGLKVDKEGRLFASGPGGVWIFSAAGRHLGTIQPAEAPANVAWGGSDGSTLYMTARSGLYRIKLNTSGAIPGA